MVSAYDYEETIEKARKVGVRDYLTKPVSVDRLLPICKEVFPNENFDDWNETISALLVFEFMKFESTLILLQLTETINISIITHL